ncbi:hypothetical protein HHL28_09390 [Aerophototrophica crusticola]|uniref:HPr kinase/phosphorylase C-terminal domain-containing protein n=1 Tax=Aerophototrophica crusticola TaxID=1709002 RepID=A0A858R8C7_9PROT|nr:hypothetical protein HHL28_09390 [Rhodospirillaceae bacterium B3]
MRHYHFSGLTVASALDLSELASVPAPPGGADASVLLGEVPDIPDSDPAQSYVQFTDAGLLLTVPDVARFLVSGGRTITVQPIGRADPAAVRLYLLGSAFGALYHQRGLLPLHAGSVEIDGMAIGFVGESGAGKTTMSAWMAARGYRLVSDDVCVTRPRPGRPPLAFPAYPRAKLCLDALAALGPAFGEEAVAAAELLPEMDKADLRVPLSAARDGLPLVAIYALEVAPDGTAPRLEPVPPAEALRVLLANTYRGHFVRGAAEQARRFAVCGEAARHVAVRRLVRPKSFDLLPAVAELVERDVARLGATATVDA